MTVTADNWHETYEARVDEHAVYWNKRDHNYDRVRKLAVSRLDGKDGIPWDDLQIIKDDLLGPETTAVEVYPPHDEIIDEVNRRHLWEFPDCPFSLAGYRGASLRRTVAQWRWAASICGVDPHPPGFVKQRRLYDCGPASLKMVMDHFGEEQPLERVSADCKVTEGVGVTFLSLKKAAESYGFHCQGQRVPFDLIEVPPLPALLHVFGDHVVVLRYASLEDDEFVVDDPSLGRLRLRRRVLENCWDNIALVFVGRQEAVA